MASLEFVRATRTVFSSKAYDGIAIGSAILLWVFLNMFDQLLFFSPVPTFYLPSYAIPSFIISNITAGLFGLVISMNIYALRHAKAKPGASFLSGSTLGIASSACVGCSSAGFFLASTFGAAGAATSAFVTNYEIPLRLASIALLIWAYYAVCRKLTSICPINSE
jgi:hypothetical protein